MALEKVNIPYSFFLITFFKEHYSLDVTCGYLISNGSEIHVDLDLFFLRVH